jgi:hypothetical protein
VTVRRLLTRRTALAAFAVVVIGLAVTVVVLTRSGSSVGPVRALVASVNGDQATVSWQAPSRGRVARYQVQAHWTDDASPYFATRIVGRSTTSMTWGALPLNHPVYFTVTPIGPDRPNDESGSSGPFNATDTVTPTNPNCPPTTAGYCVVVNTAEHLGTEQRPGAGLLSGTVPPGNEWVGALHLTHWRIQAGNPSQYADVAGVVPHQNVIEVLSDAWYGHTADGTKYAADPWSDWGAYSTYIASVVSQAKQAGQDPIWEIQNEPENYPYSPVQPPSRTLVEDEYLRAYQAIKGVDADARIIGPSIDWQYENSASPWYIDLKTFIPFAAAHGMKLYAIAWHENGDVTAQDPLSYSELPEALSDEAEVVRELIAENPGIGSPKLFVDENSSASGQFIPGFAAGYLAAEDQAGVDEANRSCWEPPGSGESNACFDPNLGELLNSDGNPNPNYWVMVDYGSMSGMRVDSEVSDVDLSALAVTDASGTTRILLGRHQTCSEPTTGPVYCSGPSTLPAAVPTTVQVLLPRSATSATVGIQPIPNSLADMSAAPVTTNTVVTLSDGLASITVPSVSDGEAYFLTVTPI